LALVGARRKLTGFSSCSTRSDLSLAPLDACRALIKLLAGLGRGNAALDQTGDADLEDQLAATDAEAVVYPNETRGLGLLAVDFDLSALDRLLSKAARLEESRGPQPLIKPD